MDLIQVKQKSIDLLKNKLGADGLTAEQIEQMNATILEKETEIANIKKQAEGLDAAKIEEIQNRMIKLENALAEPKKSVKLANYINSDQALQDFALTVRNSRTTSEFVENFRGVLAKNDITPKNTFLPPAVVSEIKDAWENNAGQFLSLLNHTGLKVFKVAFETGALNAETSRAKKWTKRGETSGTTNSKSKDEQTLTFTPKEIRPEIVYKYITLDRETTLEDENGVLIQYVSRELAQRILQEVMRAILVGDGRNDVHTKIRKFEAIARAATDNFVTVVDSAYLQPTKTDVMNAIASINTEGKLILVASKATLLALRRERGGFGGTVNYKSLADLASELGVDYIFNSNYLATTPTKNEYSVVILDADAYKIVGDMKMDTFENFLLASNAEEFLAEIYAGGGIGAMKAAAVVRCGETEQGDIGLTVDTINVDLSDVVTELQAIGTDVGRTATAVESIDTKTKDANEETGA